MRPTRLELHGFTAYAQPTTVDFSGAELFALAGPTGAGKSTLIDAMCFALYGTVPRLDRRMVAPVIALSRNEARVRFDFTVGDEPYTAVRVVRRTANGATTKEARLEDGQGTVMAGDADGVSAAVEELLGLGFDQFTTCVVLPQGHFARFLHDTPRGRQDLLVQLLALGMYDRVRAVARERATVAGTKAEGIAQRLAELDDVTDGALSQADERIAELEKLEDVVADIVPRVAAVTARAERAHQGLEDQRRLRAAAAALAVPEQIDSLDDAVQSAQAAVDEAERSRRDAEACRSRAEETRAHLGDTTVLIRRIELHERRDTVVGRIEHGREVVSQRRDTAEQAARRRASAHGAAQAAERRRDDLRREHAAHAIRQDLSPGAVCPVCRQTVTDIPDVAVPAVLDEAERERERAAAAHRSAQQDEQNALGELHAAEQLLEQLADELSTVDDQLAGHPGRSDTEAALVAVHEADAALTATLVAERASVDAERRAITEREQARAARDHAWTDFDAARDAVSRLEPPSVDRTSLTAAWATLVSWRDAAVQRIDRQIAQQEAEEQKAVGDAAALAMELRTASTAAGVDLPAANDTTARADHTVVAAVAQSLTRARAHRDRLQEQRELALRLRVERGRQHETHVVATTLARHLAANGFEQWLLDEALQRLAVDASVRLRDLSTGQYSLVVDGQRNFAVIDHLSADERRSARTLSGGETFLASLALALALADEIAGLAVAGTARLESIFLDEGFGTLDPATLDVVAGAIEELGASGRTVGIVTHVRDLAERLPVSFEVRRTPAGAQVERVER